MTLIELLFLLQLFIGLAIGASYGYHEGGILGLLLGSLVGGFIGGALGLVSMWIAISCVLKISDLWDRRTTRRELAPWFGRYWGPKQAVAWDAVKEQLVGGARVEATVLVRCGFGSDSPQAYVDLGVGFPGLLWAEQSGSAVPAKGDRIEVFIKRFDDRCRQITVSSDELTWIIWNGKTVGYLVEGAELPESGETYYSELTNTAHRDFAARLASGDILACDLACGDAVPRPVGIAKGPGTVSGSIQVSSRPA
jgi:hypothetical protein